VDFVPFKKFKGVKNAKPKLLDKYLLIHNEATSNVHGQLFYISTDGKQSTVCNLYSLTAGKTFGPLVKTIQLSSRNDMNYIIAYVGINAGTPPDGSPFLGEIRSVSFNDIPDGWLQCDGKFVSADPESEYYPLYNVIQYTYGYTQNNGIPMFAVPNLNSRYTIVLDNL